MSARTHPEKVIDRSERIAAMANDALHPLDVTISHWPSDFRAIFWDAVAATATRFADEARKQT